jgi:hypothetical protein
VKHDNVIYMDDYRCRKMQLPGNLQEVIESHLAEADRFRRFSEEVRQCLDGNMKYWPELFEERNTDPPQNQRK